MTDLPPTPDEVIGTLFTAAQGSHPECREPLVRVAADLFIAAATGRPGPRLTGPQMDECASLLGEFASTHGGAAAAYASNLSERFTSLARSMGAHPSRRLEF